MLREKSCSAISMNRAFAAMIRMPGNAVIIVSVGHRAVKQL